MIKNSRLFAVTSTTCSTPIKQLRTCVRVVAVFSPPIDIQEALVQHTVSVPIRHPSDKSSVRIVTSFEADLYIIHRKYNEIPGTSIYIRGIIMRVASVGFFLEHAGGALGIFKSPVCTYNQAGPLSASHYFSLLSKRSGRRMPPAHRSGLCPRIIY